MSDASPMIPYGREGRRMRVVGPWIATLWLLFLISPFVEGWNRWDHDRDPRGIAGMILTLAFALLYIRVFVDVRGSLRGTAPPIPLTAGAAYVGALTIMGILIVDSVGAAGTATAPFVAVMSVLLIPVRVAAPTVLLIVLGTIAVGWIPGWPDQVGNAFGVMAGALAIFGFKTVLRRNADLVSAHEVNTRLAVDNERNRFARDLHDILGHSLTVITVKAELAQRLCDIDPVRAKQELADLERLSRDALADIRRAVEGYRELTLPGELARARAALQSAEIAPDLPQSTDEVPTELRELFAWTVREGVTNVIRHSRARRCEIRLSPHGVEVRDDGAGAGLELREGSGITGLRERAAAIGAVVTTRSLSPGFSLTVAREAPAR